MKTRIDYHDPYLKCDVILLADVFEKIRNNSLKNYKLYSIHNLEVQALNWDTMFSIKKVELELVSDAYIIRSWKKV